MGLLSSLLLLPIAGPVHGLRFVLEQIQARVDAELMDENQVTAELMGLALQHDLGEISDDEYAARETELLERLNAIRAYKAELAASEATPDPSADGDAGD